MFLNNSELFTLHQVESLLMFNEDLLSKDLLNEYKVILNKLDKQKEKRNSANSKRIAEKRKKDRTYAQSIEKKKRMLCL